MKEKIKQRGNYIILVTEIKAVEIKKRNRGNLKETKIFINYLTQKEKSIQGIIIIKERYTTE